MVLENPYTHAYMKSALPLLADAFHDVHLSVRVAMCDLLVRVKQIKVGAVVVRGVGGGPRCLVGLIGWLSSSTSIV